jgi:hypothetical protein
MCGRVSGRSVVRECCVEVCVRVAESLCPGVCRSVLCDSVGVWWCESLRECTRVRVPREGVFKSLWE